MSKKLNHYVIRCKEQGFNPYFNYEIKAKNAQEALEKLCKKFLLEFEIGYHYIWVTKVIENDNLIFHGIGRIKEINL